MKTPRKRNAKAKVRPARCKHVLVILNNRLETVELMREEIHPGVGDFDDAPLEFGVVRWHGLEIFVALECVVFLARLRAEPQWIQEARARVEKELASKIRQSGKRPIDAEREQDREGD